MEKFAKKYIYKNVYVINFESNPPLKFKELRISQRSDVYLLRSTDFKI